MKPWLWLVLLAGTIAGAVVYLKMKGPTPTSGEATTQAGAPSDNPPHPETQSQPGLESSSGPLGGEITPRQQNSAPQPLAPQNQSPPIDPAPFNPNDPSAFPPPPSYPSPDSGVPSPPPIDPPSYVPPPDNNFDNVEPPPNYVDPVQPYNPEFDGNPPPPPPPPSADDEFQ